MLECCMVFSFSCGFMIIAMPGLLGGILVDCIISVWYKNMPRGSRPRKRCIPPEDSDERRQGAAECLTPEKLNAALQHILETRLENKDKKGHNGSALEYWPDVIEKAGGA